MPTSETIVEYLRWAVPICFGLHVFEEFLWPGGFIEWYHLYRPKLAAESRSYYYIANAVYFALTLRVPLAHSGTGSHYTLLFVSGLLLSNLVFTHIRGTIKTKRFSPGIVTGILYVPLFVASYGFLLSKGLVSWPGALVCLALSPLPEIYFAWKPAFINNKK